MSMHRWRYLRGFTLPELLVTISIIAILAGLTMSATLSAERSVHQAACANNLRQLGIGSMLYSDDDTGGNLSSCINDADNNLSWLFPNYLAATRSFLCPATRNTIRSDVFQTNPVSSVPILKDLTDIAGRPKGFGLSYEVFGFMNYNGNSHTEISLNGRRTLTRGVKKTAASVTAYVHTFSAFGLNGVVPSPTRIWLLTDGDSGATGGYNNYPDPGDNHGNRGVNAVFCDGHVEWIPLTRYLFQYELSQDENRSGPQEEPAND